MVSSDDRGQLLLITALVVAVTILGSVTLLNSIHESPATATEQDSRSLEEAERAASQSQTNLERLFRYTTSADEADKPLPYADKSDLEDAVDEYNEQLLNVSTLRSAGIVDITYNDSAPLGGIATGQIGEATNPPGSFDWLIQQAGDVPRIDLNITTPPSSSYFLVEFNESSSAVREFNITRDSGDIVVTFDDPSSPSSMWECDVGDPSSIDQIQIDVRADTAVIQTEDSYCERSVNLPAGQVDIRFVDPDDTVEGAFAVTGTDPNGSDFLPSSPGDDVWYKDSVVVDPAFDIVYASPEVSYEAWYRLYGGEA